MLTDTGIRLIVKKVNTVMKLWEATVREPGPGTPERQVRVAAESAQEARRQLQQLYGPRSVPYLPRQVPQ
jgi:hypothetical protein